MRLAAESQASLFAEAGRALAELFVNPPPRASGAWEKVTLHASDRDALLVAWLNELIFRNEVERRIFVEFEFARLSETDLTAKIRGGAVDEIRTLVKAATLHGLRIEEEPRGLAATVIVDV